MKNAAQLKSLVKNLSIKSGISSQLVLQNYMLERLLERISKSKYKENFILKGGCLVASLVGLSTRSTMDIDATIKSFPVTEDSIRSMFQEVISVLVDDNIVFELSTITEIREKDEYNGFRILFFAHFEPMKIPVKVDITTGDEITPKEIRYDFKLMFEDRSLQILSYNLETLLAEKLETIISRSTENTRARDFYDVFILSKLKNDEINYSLLKKALLKTAEKRGTSVTLSEWEKVLDDINSSEVMNAQWKRYSKTYSYAANIDFSDCVDSIGILMQKIDTEKYF